MKALRFRRDWDLKCVFTVSDGVSGEEADLLLTRETSVLLLPGLILPLKQK